MCYARLEAFSLAVEEKIDTTSDLVNKMTIITNFNELEEDLRTDSITAHEIQSAAAESYMEYYTGYRQQLADIANIDIGDHPPSE